MRFLIVLVFFMLLGCSSTNTIVSEEKMKQLEEVVLSKKIHFTAIEALPQSFFGNAGLDRLLPLGSNQTNIILSNIPNFVKMNKDSISVDLPYYGEIQMTSAYGSDSDLKFEGKIKNYSKKIIDKNKSYTILFSANSKNEGLRFVITMFPNNTYTMNVNSSNRSSITYKGNWKKNID